MSDSSPLPKTFHIFYGWAEGPWHGRQLIAKLQDAGFVEAPVAEATVVIAHSIGCYLVPLSDKNRVILLIGPPFWPGKSIVVRVIRKIWRDFIAHQSNILQWLQKTFWNIYYACSRPNITVQWQAVHDKNPFASIPGRAIVVRNKQDVFCTPNLKNVIKLRVIELAGQHDDCWLRPARYVKLINTEHERLGHEGEYNQ